ncbi:hypothetical protein ACH5RR_030853 [Cinchona calisaya]|uniref:Uncharacterized protein n=1 Tax=Cinchona calisaya TaxID=153742 RepID=A0ABD2YVW0_9GENT
MESKDKVELLKIAIKQLIEEDKLKNVKESSSDESFVAISGNKDDPPDDHHLLLSKLLSQLDPLKEDGSLEELKPEGGEKSSETANEASDSSSEIGGEEIMEELKKVKKQNFITHCLLSTMIVLTVAWQLSEVSLILKLKEGLSNPFKFLGGLITGMLKGPRITGQEVEKLASSAKDKPLLAASSLPGLKIPKLPLVELPVFDFDSEEE